MPNEIRREAVFLLGKCKKIHKIKRAKYPSQGKTFGQIHTLRFWCPLPLTKILFKHISLDLLFSLPKLSLLNPLGPSKLCQRGLLATDPTLVVVGLVGLWFPEIIGSGKSRHAKNCPVFRSFNLIYLVNFYMLLQNFLH